MKRTPLKRSGPLRRRRKAANPAEDLVARALWKDSKAGFCACGCGRFSMHLERHHVIELQELRRLGRHDLAWDLTNSMLLHPFCHARHTSAFRRIRIERVPVAALSFAVGLFGEVSAAERLHRYYDCTVTL